MGRREVRPDQLAREIWKFRITIDPSKSIVKLRQSNRHTAVSGELKVYNMFRPPVGSIFNRRVAVTCSLAINPVSTEFRSVMRIWRQD